MFEVEFTAEKLGRSSGRLGARGGEPPWHFLARSASELRPRLAGFDQDVRAFVDESHQAPVLSHVLKVFLPDRHGTVREISTTAHLGPAVVVNDIHTLLMGARTRASRE